MTPSERIRKEAQEAAQKVLDVAQETAKVLAAETALNIKYIQKDVSEIKSLLNSTYVTKEEFSTVKMIAYGLVSVILITVVGAVISQLILKK